MSERAAFFDVDGTIVASDIVHYAVAIRTQGMSPLWRRAWTALFVVPRVPWYLAVDAISREAFQRSFYRIYAGLSPDELARRAERLFDEFTRPRIRPQAAARVTRHRERGDRVVLVSGSVEPIVLPLARHLGVSDILAARLETKGGVFTGGLEDGALAGRRKAEVVAAFAAGRGVDLGASHGYADSLDDVPLLELVGRPAVVNPGRKLARLARARGWDVYRWRAPAEFGLRPVGA